MAVWTTAKTWVVGEVLTAANMNVYVRDNTQYLHDSSAFTLLWDSIDSGVTLPAASITTSSLPQTYKHLLAISTLRETSGTSHVGNSLLRYNGDSGSRYYRGVTARTGFDMLEVDPAEGGLTDITAANITLVPDYARASLQSRVHLNVSTASGNDGVDGTVNGLVYYGSYKAAAAGAVTTLTWAALTTFAVPTRISVYGIA